MSKARIPPTDAPMATAMVESLGGGTGQRKTKIEEDKINQSSILLQQKKKLIY